MGIISGILYAVSCFFCCCCIKDECKENIETSNVPVIGSAMVNFYDYDNDVFDIDGGPLYEDPYISSDDDETKNIEIYEDVILSESQNPKYKLKDL